MIKRTSNNCDGTEYNLDDLSDNAKSQLSNIQFVDAQIQQLNNEWAVAMAEWTICSIKAGLEKIEIVE